MIASLAAPFRSAPPIGEHGIAADEARIARPLLVAGFTAAEHAARSEDSARPLWLPAERVRRVARRGR